MLWKSRKRFVSSFAIAFLCGSLLSPARAQEIDPNDIIRVNTDLVVLDAQVINKKSRSVFSGLRKQDFEIYEENLKQELIRSGTLKINDKAMKAFLASYSRGGT